MLYFDLETTVLRHNYNDLSEISLVVGTLRYLLTENY